MRTVKNLFSVCDGHTLEKTTPLKIKLSFSSDIVPNRYNLCHISLQNIIPGLIILMGNGGPMGDGPPPLIVIRCFNSISGDRERQEVFTGAFT